MKQHIIAKIEIPAEIDVNIEDNLVIIKLGDSWALGAEVSKDIHNTNSEEG